MPSSNSSLQVLHDFIMEQSQEIPVRHRVILYRALADFCHTEQQSATLLKLADDLDDADHRCREFKFQSQRIRK